MQTTKEKDIQILHWALAAAKKTIEMHGDQEIYTCSSGVTPSGTIHIGNFREIITVELVKRAFSMMGKKARHIHSWDDFDVFRKVPINMPKKDILEKYLRCPITKTPDTFECSHASYAEHNIANVESILPSVGINPLFLRQAELYGKCTYAEEIKTALEHTAEIREILDRYRKEPLSKDWLPVSIFCERCCKDTIKNIEYRGGYNIYYECVCGHSEEFDIRKKGIIKLKWRVDWPMRWHYEKINFEPAGKDHFASGGSRDSGVEIQKDVWGTISPYGFMYEWIAIKGGGEFSSSKGVATTLQDVLEIYEPEIVRYLFAGTRPNSGFNISFDLDVMKIYEDYDKLERIYYEKEEAGEKELEKSRLIYQLSQIEEDVSKIPAEMPIQVSFRNIVNVLNIKGMDEAKAYSEFADKVKGEADEKKLKTRISCVKNWIEKYAGDNFRFSVNEEKNEGLFLDLNEKEKNALTRLKEAIASAESPEQLEELIFSIPKQCEIEMKDFFRISYQAIISKDRGPKLARFILEIGKEKVLKLL
jgi:lysyl-tRNA synthetase, class I